VPGLRGFDVSISKDAPDTHCKQKKFGRQCAIRDSVAFGSKISGVPSPGLARLTGRGASKAITVQASAISRRVCRRWSSSVSSAKRRHSQANCWHFWRLDMAQFNLRHSATFHSGRQRAGMPTMIKIRSLLPILVRHLPKFARYLFGSRYLGIPGANPRQFNQFVARHRHWAQLQYPMRGRSE